MSKNDNDLTDILELEIAQLITTRYNVVTGIVEYSKDNGKSFRPMTDYFEKTILRRLKSKGHSEGLSTVRNILYSDFSTPYNPFKEYFESLPKWDKETNYIKQYCNLVNVKNNEYWVKWFTKWIVGLVAGATNKNVVNHQILVLAGGQGIGKTTWLENIVPKALSDYSCTGYINPESKDALILASESFLVNMDELSSLNPKSIEALKQLITQTKIKLRRPYGRNPENLEKRASFCGSTNEDQFLIDSTGNRRFLSFRIHDVDLDKIKEVDIDKVYSQAYSLYKSGFKYFFDKKENILIDENNKDYVVRSVEEEYIMQRYEPCKKNEKDTIVLKWTATEVMADLSSKRLVPNSNSSAQRVGKALVKLGFERFKSNGRMLYALKLKQNAIAA